MKKNELVTTEEAAAFFRVSKRQIYHLVETGRVPFYCVGKRTYRFDLEELRKFFARKAA